MEETRVETLDGEAFPVPVKVTLGRAIRPVWDSVAAYPEAVLFIVLFVHFAAFSTLAIITHPTLDLDVIEQISWARNIEWGYYKHPPLPAWSLAALLTLTGGHPWIGAIAGPAAATLGLWLVWLLARRILDPARALPAVLLLEGVVYFNVLSLEFNHNVIQLPLWAFIAYASHRAIREGRTQDWLLFGFAAALGMLGKYSTALLLLSIGGYILFDPVARQHLTRKGPWIAVLTGTLLLIPHMNAVYAYNFSPLLTPSNELLIAASFWQRFGFPAGWLLAQLGDIAAALILAAVLFTGRATKIRVPGSEVARADRNFILFLFLGPLLFAVAFQGLGGVRFRDMWGFPMFDFLGLAIMALTATNALFQERIKRFCLCRDGRVHPCGDSHRRYDRGSALFSAPRRPRAISIASSRERDRKGVGYSNGRPPAKNRDRGDLAGWHALGLPPRSPIASHRWRMVEEPLDSQEPALGGWRGAHLGCAQRGLAPGSSLRIPRRD